MNVLQFENDGPLLVASDYWQSPIAAAGKLYVSINAGAGGGFNNALSRLRTLLLIDGKTELVASEQLFDR
jgi:hypothetical protein